MISRRTLFGGIGAATLLVGCASKQPAGTASSVPAQTGDGPITVGLTYIPNVQFSAFYLAAEEKLFGDIEVNIRHHGEQEELFGALLRDEEQIVFASSDEAVIAGKGLTTVATAYQQYPVQIMFREEAKSLADLKGRTLGVPGRFGSSWYATLVALHSAGLTENDVDIQEIGFTMVPAMATAKVDAVAGFSNNEAVQLASMGQKVWAFPISDEPMLVGPGLITTAELAGDPRVKAVVDGMLAAQQRIIENPEAALEATKKHVPALADATQMETARAVLKATSELWKGADGKVSVDVDQSAMKRMEQFLKDSGIIQ